MPRILGIETSCDETGAAVFDTAAQKIVAHALFSQIELHKIYGGVVPEIASRSQLEKIDLIVQHALTQANCTVNDIDVIAVTSGPGLVGSLLVGLSFAKGIAWSLNKKIIGIDHLEGHIFSSLLNVDGSVNNTVPFPFISLSASGGHTMMHMVHGLGKYELIGQTSDDAAGEAFDKIAKVLGLGYPGGAAIEQLAVAVGFQDFFAYPRTKPVAGKNSFSFSGLKTAVLYDLVKRGAYDLTTGTNVSALTPELQQQVASSLLVCIGDIFAKQVKIAFRRYPQVKALTFAGGVACNKYLRARLNDTCVRLGKKFIATPPSFCTDNAAMIAFVGSYHAAQGLFSDLTVDAVR